MWAHVGRYGGVMADRRGHWEVSYDDGASWQRTTWRDVRQRLAASYGNTPGVVALAQRTGHASTASALYRHVAPTTTFEPGTRCTWSYTPRGGYGYTMPVDVVVIRCTEKRVLVQAPLREGGTRQVWVTPEKLRRKDSTP